MLADSNPRSTYSIEILKCRNNNKSLHFKSHCSYNTSKEYLASPKSIDDEPPDQTFLERNFSGWRGGIAHNVIIALSVLVVNISFLLWATAKFDSYGLITVYNGSCSTAKHLSIAVHIMINILSTLLLGASNYAMQVASSPSRNDVDRAHQRQQWLDIGVLSFRNLRWISRYRLLAYALLLSSSIPLHFM